VGVSLLEKYSQLALSTFSPSQASSVIPVECAECRELIEYLKPYILSVLEEPSNVESVAKRLLEDERALSLLTLVFQITLMRISERDLVTIYRELGERFKSVGVDVEDALEAILEHDLWKLRQVRSNFGRFALMYLDFIANYPDDAYNYVVTLLSTMLLLLATYETVEPTKLKSIREVLRTLSEELESYTLTFMLMLEKPGVEEEVSATARTREELRRVFGLE
jgi:hypothetical protein